MRLYAERNARILLDTTTQDSTEDEETSLYHVLKMIRRRETRIQHVQDPQGHNITKPKELRNVFVTHLHQRYNHTHEDSDSLMMQVLIQPVGRTKDAAVLDQPISTEEIHHALRAGARHKSPGIDGICMGSSSTQ